MTDIRTDLLQQGQDAAPFGLGGNGAVEDFWALLKPRVMSLVVFTAICGLLLAPGEIHPWTAFVAILCIAVGAGASGALNMAYDADIDIQMSRTAKRPIPRGAIEPGEAYIFGTALAVGSVVLLGLAANWVSAAFLAFTIFFYAVIYTSVPEALDAAEHCHWRCSRCVSSNGGVVCCDRIGRPGKRIAVPDHIHVDPAALLGAGAVPVW